MPFNFTSGHSTAQVSRDNPVPNLWCSVRRDNSYYVLTVSQLWKPLGKYACVYCPRTILHDIWVGQCLCEKVYVVREQLGMALGDMQNPFIGQFDILT